MNSARSDANRWPACSPQRGVTLVELMVAMAISIFMMGAVLYVVQETRVTYNYNDHLGRIQEAGRIAVDRMGHEVRMAGYTICQRPPGSSTGADESTVRIKVLALPPVGAGLDQGGDDPTWNPFASVLPVQGFTYPDAQVNFVDDGALQGVPNSNVLILTGMSADGIANIVGNIGPTNANFQIDRNPGFRAGDLILVTDCVNGHLVRATTVSSGSGTVTISHAANANRPGQFRFDAAEGAMAARFQQQAFYLRDTGRVNAAGRPVISLFRMIFNLSGGAPRVEELVEGVEDMRILYGVDTTGRDPATVMQYMPAELVGDWFNVVSVRIQLLVSSTEDNVLREQQNYVFNNVAVVPDDRRMRQTFEVTAALRNRLQ